MNLYERIVAGEEKISLVGLGYVGMPIAVAFAEAPWRSRPPWSPPNLGGTS
jgi:hypothetical protein